VRKPSNKKGINIAVLPKEIREVWTANKTVAENFKDLGLSLNMAPRMLQSKVGTVLTEKYTKEMNPNFFSNRKKSLRE
jgi:hypothetical protein